eukprot:ctg_1139.g399
MATADARNVANEDEDEFFVLGNWPAALVTTEHESDRSSPNSKPLDDDDQDGEWAALGPSRRRARRSGSHTSPPSDAQQRKRARRLRRQRSMYGKHAEALSESEESGDDPLEQVASSSSSNAEWSMEQLNAAEYARRRRAREHRTATAEDARGPPSPQAVRGDHSDPQLRDMWEQVERAEQLARQRRQRPPTFQRTGTSSSSSSSDVELVPEAPGQSQPPRGDTIRIAVTMQGIPHDAHFWVTPDTVLDETLQNFGKRYGFNAAVDELQFYLDADPQWVVSVGARVADLPLAHGGRIRAVLRHRSTPTAPSHATEFLRIRHDARAPPRTYPFPVRGGGGALPLRVLFEAFCRDLHVPMQRVRFYDPEGDPMDPDATAEDVGLENEDLIDAEILR